MGSIPLPALGIKAPEVPGVMDQYQKGLGIKALIDQQKLRGQQIETGQRGLDEDTALKQAVAAAGGDVRKALPEIMRISPDKGLALQKQFEEWDSADITKKKAIIDLHAKKAERVGQLAGTVKDSESRDLALQIAVKEQLIPPEEAQKMAQQPFDPKVYQDLQMQGMSAQEQHAAAQKELDRQDRLTKEKADREAPTANMKEFGDFYSTWLEANELPKNAKNELQARKEFKELSKTTAAGSASEEDVKDTVQSIIEGHANPVLSNYSFRDRTAIAAGLQRAGYNQALAEQDWKATQKHLSTLNGQQQERLRQAISFTTDSLPIIEGLYNEWLKVGPASGFKVFNKASLEAAKQVPGKAGEVATNLQVQINDLTSELGTVYKGGNSSTDESLKLAGENLKADWNEQTFKRAIEQIKKNLAIRKNSIVTSEAVGVSLNSPYSPQPSPAAPAPAGVPSPAGAPSSNGLPAGWK